jgi:hypothetical protein
MKKDREIFVQQEAQRRVHGALASVRPEERRAVLAAMINMAREADKRERSAKKSILIQIDQVAA